MMKGPYSATEATNTFQGSLSSIPESPQSRGVQRVTDYVIDPIGVELCSLKCKNIYFFITKTKKKIYTNQSPESQAASHPSALLSHEPSS